MNARPLTAPRAPVPAPARPQTVLESIDRDQVRESRLSLLRAVAPARARVHGSVHVVRARAWLPKHHEIILTCPCGWEGPIIVPEGGPGLSIACLGVDAQGRPCGIFHALIIEVRR